MSKPLLPLAVSFVSISTLYAVELADLAGDWNLTELQTPSRLREQYQNTETGAFRTTFDSSGVAGEDEVLHDVFYPDPALVGQRSLSISDTGVVTGDETGNILGISRNRLLYSDGEDLVNLYTNTAGDIILTNSEDDDQQSVTMILKKPDAISLAELAGNWTLISFITPKDISKNTSGGRVSDVFFGADAQTQTYSVTMDASGNLTGAFPGTVTTGTDSITVDLGPQQIIFKVNASKDFMTARIADDDEEELLVLLKNPSAVNTSDLAGTWSISTLRIPTTLTETYYNDSSMSVRFADSDQMPGANETLVDVFHPDSFTSKRYQLAVDNSGAFTGIDSGGTLTPQAGGVVLFNIDGDLPLNINAGKTLMIGTTGDDDELELIVAIKTSGEVVEDLEERAELVTLREPSGKLILNWNAEAGTILEEASSLSPDDWGVSPASSSSGSAVIDPEEALRKFFRIAPVGE